ncbi:hypothetical protein H4R19_001582 [Coemansia spiralis]|nr:hypothetical protein H4R19_001582 [Coemansia spiralis]
MAHPVSATEAVRRTQGLLQRLGLARKRLLLAVSGGADSMALAYVAGQAAGPENCYAVTVDHGFRAESAHEAQDVGRWMRELGIRHEIRTLDWDQGATPPIQRLEEAARQRRYAELGSICQERGIGAVLTGHHAGDQAETFLFRLLRQSGVYGLAGMPVQAAFPVVPWADGGMGAPGPVVVRPLLALDKAALYGICRDRGIRWHEDESNRDTRIRRNMLRQVIAAAEPGSPFSAPALLEVCAAMQRHREFVNREVAGLLAAHARFRTELGVVELADMAESERRLPRWAGNAALRERVLASVVGWVNCQNHPPELAHLRQFERAIARFYSSEHWRQPCAPVVAAGVAMYPPAAGHMWLFCRQPPRLAEIEPLAGQPLGSTALWDRRLLVRVCERPGRVRPEGLTWSACSLHDAMRLWPECIATQRRALRRSSRALELHHAVQSALPVVSVGDAVVFALGQPVAASSAASMFDASVRACKGTAVPGASEVVA